MRQKILQCPDSPRVLAQYDLDLTSFERGLDMLCDNIGGRGRWRAEGGWVGGGGLCGTIMEGNT